MAASLLLLGALSSCDDDDDPPPGSGGGGGGGFTPTPTSLRQGDPLPGIDLDILAVTGGSGNAGRFRAGDRITVEFTVKKADDSVWHLGEFGSGRILVSGPTSNYQRVIGEQTDVVAKALATADGTWSYTFTEPIPAGYLPPVNDTASFGEADGELTGQSLLPGTYTVGLYLIWNYTVDGEGHRDAGNAVEDFLFGDGDDALAPRAVVAQENCNQCHQSLRAHGDMRREVGLCVLCHTAGAEDRNVATVENGTPGVSVDFRVLIHKIHNGGHLPSVLGIGTKADGTRDYSVTPQPYRVVGFNDSVTDYSGVGFPVMPSLYTAYLFNSTGTGYLGTGGNGPMPRDIGYAALPLAAKEKEDHVRAGSIACAKCHGDPDGDGPIGAPAQGNRIYEHPQRQSCGSCHDDIHWGRPYTSNGQTMGEQANNGNCRLCHTPSGSPISVATAHRHPYTNPDLNQGVNLTIDTVAGGSGPGGRHAAGDPLLVTFQVKDDAGADLQVHRLTRLQMIVTGPAANPQWVLPNVNTYDFAFRKGSPFTGNGTASVPVVGAGAVAQTIALVHTSATTFDVVGSVTPPLTGVALGAGSGSRADVTYQGLTFTVVQGTTAFAANDRWFFEVAPTAPSYSAYVPRDLTFERLGVATGNAQQLPAANTPVYWGRQVVYERTALVGSPGTTAVPAAAMQRYVVTDQALLTGIAVGDRVVLAQGTGVEEYVQVSRIQTTDDETGADLGTHDRFFFTQFLRYEHPANTALQECTLSTRREGTDYTLAPADATGIDLLPGRFTAGNPVVINYRSHARFGYYRAPGEPLAAVYTPATGDSDEVGAAEGDWTALPLVSGTYTVGMWANVDFSVTPLGVVTATRAWNDINTDDTTYRSISPPATKAFLFGDATALAPRQVITDPASCNRCHDDIQAHGFGRRGLETCLVCHASAGAEDAPLYSFNNWYIGPTPRASIEFRSLIHQVHMGKELANASTYTVNGIFLGVPYPVQYDEIGFPAMPGGAANCALCHGASSTAWQVPAARNHPDPAVPPTRAWRAACASCHDSSAAVAHIDTQTSNRGQEGCAVCHGAQATWSVERMHKRY